MSTSVANDRSLYAPASAFLFLSEILRQFAKRREIKGLLTFQGTIKNV